MDWGKCIWCGCGSTKPTFVCSAPDGNGHLFERAVRTLSFVQRQRVVCTEEKTDAKTE